MEANLIERKKVDDSLCESSIFLPPTVKSIRAILKLYSDTDEDTFR